MACRWNLVAVYCDRAGCDGIPVTPASSLLNLANGGAGTSVSYDIVVLGTE
jgi:hypothetical protein